ncbi:probable E3 ubiquitin-protein ligase MARCHF10 isoform X1 [Panthera uncia]|uniref:probable E3 ubiquitin-protein ligase MARCHF10 isoform X1 n=1 Tax=Panthera uncia TaxID=29064 RepID=UPI0020FF8220|nr:probable E3 ubiquitin-protein ligase MARCHF10 isoform X1 [Panthera uncia]XP_049493536.1 probable E3 ubiquitin-protein ligase MARCHF10 isoform X1 [Panthera uncia]XP_049493537.1 probable E3 ubiquitin-protein ligase MARCHF10 isoform X1 [Panthera uncia]XP_049493538.1 probable E3 ubiquitin-protein ligase MARCHF10 isoform X1 [Panthera uncia]XP_049493539.1 probable E3 ubiquitin-protein ligase MARCHF10 isoform X1 [Panthera uncia]
MLHEARDRQKFVSDVQYLRDIQHKADSEYQACLRRQEYRRDPNEKKQDQFGGQETNLERPRFSTGSSSKQSSGEEDSVAEPRLSTKSSSVKGDSRLPAIDQTSVKQKHKSTMTPRKPEKGGPSKPSSAAQAPQILSRKRRPNLGRLTVSPETQSPRVPGDRSRQKSQLPVKSPALRGPDPIVQQEGPVWASGTKLKRPTRERRHLVPSSQLMTMTENTSERAKKGDSSVLSQNEPHSGLSQAFLGTNSPQVSSESLGPPLLTTTMGGSRRAPFRFRDEDFYSILSLNPGAENDDTEEETLIEEELLLVGMHRPRSPPSHKRSRFLGTSSTQAKSKNLEESPENCRANSVRRTESSRGSLRMSNAMEPVTEQLPVGARVFQDLKPPGGGSPNGNDSGDSEHEKSTFPSWDTKSTASLDDDLNAENGFRDCTSTEDRPGIRDYERDWHAYLSSSSNSLDCFLSGRPTAPRSPVSLSYNTPGSLMHSATRDDIPVDLSMSSTFIHSSDSEGNSRFNVRRPLSPIRNRNPLASAENHGYFPVNSAHEFDVRGAEDIPLTNPSQGALEYTEELLLNPQSNLSLGESSSSSPSRMNLQGHLHVPGSLQENTPFTFFAVSDFPNQSDNRNRMAASAFTDEKEANKIKADSEKLKKLQESLLEEDSEEEGDLCRICQIAGGSPTNPLLEPCGCVGSLRFVHQECLKKWLKVKITSGADLGAAKTCEMCKQDLLVDLDDFNVTDFYHKHQQSRAQNELMNSGLYLALLLHLYEQRSAELMRRNYNRVIRERIPSWGMETIATATLSSKGAGPGALQRHRPTAASSTSPYASFPPPPPLY